MDKYVFKTDKVGKIELRELFFFFEEPLVFSASDSSGNLYLMNRINKDEYAIAPISEDKMYFSKIQKVQARNIFTHPEGETFILFGEPNGKEASMTVKGYKEDELPYPGVCLTN